VPVVDPMLHTGNFTLREIFALVNAADSFIAVDSLIPHIAYAFGKKGIVCWGSTSSKSLGYATMTNIYKNGFELTDPWQARFPSNNEKNKGCMDYDEETVNKIIEAADSYANR
jgi:ADP-heptose:LPS heptosyltransferase